MKKTPEQQNLLAQMKQVADGLGQTLAPFCEVVLHDLLDPEHAILAIHNNLSGRGVGAPAWSRSNKSRLALSGIVVHRGA